MRGNVPLLKAPLLEKLDLGLCGITALPPKTFQGMLHLKEFILDNNSLSLLTEAEQKNNVFTNLHQLSTLDLSRNNITEINSNFLYGMDNLDVLNLSFNPAVCDECIIEDKCNAFRTWCRSISDRCVARCRLQEVNTQKIEQETDKNVPMEKDLTTLVTLGVGSFIIIIGVVLVVVIVRRKRRTGKFFPNVKEITLCQRRKQLIPTEC
jgi:hypothetical protein